MFIGLFSTLKTLEVPVGTDALQTGGWAAPGVGAARYVATAEALPAVGNGVWWTTSTNGRTFKLSPEEAVTPRKFGAAGNGTGSDEAALQAAINYIQTVRGRGALHLEGLTYRCPTTGLTFDPMRTAVHGEGGKLDFSARTGAGAAVLASSLAGSPQYGAAPFVWTGVELAGPGLSSQIDGLVLDTLVAGLSTRLTAEGSDIHGFRSGLKLVNRTYGDRIFGMEVYACDSAVEFVSGTQDAGENISFFGCAFYNSNVAIRNTGGAGLFFFGCSLDYCGQWFVGGGTNSFTNCWFEKQKPATLTQYPFDLVGAGDVVIHGGLLQIADTQFAAGPLHAYMFNTSSKFGRFALRDVAGFNWRTTTGELLGGPGRLEIEGLRGGANHQIPTVTKRDARHNLFGAGGQFEGQAIAVNTWLTGGTGRLSRYGVEWRNGANQYAIASLAISGTYARTGSKSLKFAKTGVGSGTACNFYFAAPIRTRSIVGVEFWTRTPKALGGSGTAPLYLEAYFAAMVGVDGDGVPILGDLGYIGGKTLNVDLAAGQSDWTANAFGTAYADDSSAGDGYAPEWATHIVIVCNPASMPSGFELYLDDLGAWTL